MIIRQCSTFIGNCSNVSCDCHLTQTANLRDSENREQHKSSGLESELSEAESAVSELRSENTGIKQDLQDALELCGQHESLLEERNRELESCDAEIRYCPCNYHELYYIHFNLPEL